MALGLRNLVKPKIFRNAAALRKRPTDAERALWKALSLLHPRWQFQCIVRGFILDFYCSKVKVAVEVDGSSHDTRKRYDENRDALLRNQLGIITLRFSNAEVLADPEEVAHKVLQFCSNRQNLKSWNSK